MTHHQNTPQNTDPLDTLLQRHLSAVTPADDAAAARVMRKLAAAPLPRQRGSWLRWPATGDVVYELHLVRRSA